jgi:hypothetical protein
MNREVNLQECTAAWRSFSLNFLLGKATLFSIPSRAATRQERLLRHCSEGGSQRWVSVEANPVYIRGSRGRLPEAS